MKITLDYKDLIPVIERVRRAMPRNVDVMQICDALDVLAVQRMVEPMMGIERVQTSKKSRAPYMRDYRRKERELIRKARGGGKSK
jgi:hypothetical protein